MSIQQLQQASASIRTHAVRAYIERRIVHGSGQHITSTPGRHQQDTSTLSRKA